MLLNILICAAGFVLLYYGADFLVKGAAGLAAGFGISPMVVGLSVVAIGTSTPEMIVSLLAAIKGQSMMAVGNIVGSNICNMALGVGLAGLLFKITAAKTVVKRDMPIMLVTFVIAMLVLANGVVGRLEGLILLVLLVVYIGFNYRLSVRDGYKPEAETTAALAVKPRAGQIAGIVGGIVGLAAGAKLVVDAASALMITLGASERFVGLTIVAVGTSLPELITSIVAAAKKESAISLGNIIGSNVFNLFGALGLSALFAPVVIMGGFFTSGGLWVDYLVMFIICGLTCLLMWKSLTIWRKGGALLVGLYAVYVIWLLQTQTG